MNELYIVENDKKRAFRNFEKFVKRPLADFYHSPQAQVAQILINILFPLIAKTCSMNSQVLFCTPSKKGITIIPLLLSNQSDNRNTICVKYRLEPFPAYPL